MGNFFFRRVENLFLWSSGANLEVLDQVPTEKSKYFGIGGTIVFTALMASFAGGYAFFTAFKSFELAIPFGIFWGCLIFNLDRYIVASFGVGDGKKTISKQEVIEAFPRLLMAIILGFVISTPLELKLFEKEINAKIDTDISVVQKKIIRSATEDVQIKSLNQEKSKLEKDIQSRQNIIDSKKTFWEQSEKDKNDEWNTGKFSGKIGKGGYYTDLLEKAKNAGIDYQKINSQYSALNIKDFGQIDKINKKIEQREEQLRKEVANQKTVQSQNDGLLARLSALNELTKKEWTLWASKWLITLLFIFIEIAPILFKMMTERGPYDDIIDRIKHETMVRQLEIQSELNQEINSSLKISEQKSIMKIDKEIQTYEEILNEVSKVQKELSLISINKWKEEQLALLNNPNSPPSSDSTS
jgi:hypothetical protein